VLLGAVTSLPEIVTTTTASLAGDAALAVNSVLGSDSMQLVMLAVADVLIGRKALTSTIPRADVLAYSAMNILLMAIACGAVVSGDFELFGMGIGLGALLLLLAYCGCIAVVRSMKQQTGWRPISGAPVEEEEARDESASLHKLGWLIAAAGAVILVAGYIVTRTGEAIAMQTGLGSSFFGFLFLATITSLPEASSAIAAVRRKRPQLAMGDILGGNIFNLMLIFLTDLIYRGGPVLGEVGTFSAVAATVAIALNAILIVGMVERRDKTIFRMGYDAFAMLLLYAAGAVLLFQLRP
jgi:cation:H+ antiporter